MTPIEVVAALLGVANVTLVVRRSVWNYPFGIAMVALYAVVFYREKLYSDALLQLFFFAVQFWGWAAWRAARAAAGEVVVRRLSEAKRALWAGGCAIAVAVWGGLMFAFTDASYPWWDAAVAAISVAAQILMIRRYVENWWLWIAVDLVAIGLYAAKGLWPTTMLYFIFLLLATWGLLHWNRVHRAAGPAMA